MGQQCPQFAKIEDTMGDSETSSILDIILKHIQRLDPSPPCLGYSQNPCPFPYSLTSDDELEGVGQECA